MKTLNELYNEILASEEMKEELSAIGADRAKFDAFLAKYGCSASPEEAQAFILERREEIRQLSAEELSAAAGGNTTVIGASLIMPANCIACSLCVQFLTEDDCVDILD